MSENFSYQSYVADEKFLAEYNEYQKRYAGRIRESDKVIIAIVRDLLAQAPGKHLRVLDIGCSTGNLLMHLKRMVPDASYVGGDLARSSLEDCRRNPELSGIDFEEMDIFALAPRSVDIVIVNAVFYMFDEEQYASSLGSVHKALRDGGTAVIYDFAHPFEHQNLTIYETSVLHPQGLRLSFRPMGRIRSAMTQAGFSGVEFRPFELPIDLPMPGHDQDVVTYTLKGEKQNRMMFRGSLYQPWCHMIARR
jgi:SAM-dependent methyltransferase